MSRTTTSPTVEPHRARQAERDESSAAGRPKPVLGPLAKTAASLPLRYPLGREHRKLLVLVAAYRDAGEPSPPVRELARRLGLGGEPGAARKIDKRLKALERAGVLTVAWRAGDGGRNVYELHLGGEA